MEQEQINQIILDCLTKLQNINRKPIDFTKLLQKCNPYELVVECRSTDEVADFIMINHIKTSRGTIWGDFLELIAIKICESSLNGYKSKEACTDLEWVDQGKKHYRGFKSSPKWANADQKKTANNKDKELREQSDFGSYKVLTSYGKTAKRTNENNFVQLSGQDAWQEISNDQDMYKKVMTGIDINSGIIGQFLKNIYTSDMDRSTKWFSDNFITDNKINSIKIVEYVSSRDKINVTKW
jgi:hypothetical protein